MNDDSEKKDELVPVTSQDEIEVGMALFVSPCFRHRGRQMCALTVLRTELEMSGIHLVEDCVIESHVIPVARKVFTTHSDRSACFCNAIRDRRLFRLKPTQEANDYDETVADRTKERAVGKLTRLMRDFR